LADAVLSTDGMIMQAVGSKYKEFIVATELEVVNRMAEDNRRCRSVGGRLSGTVACRSAAGTH